MEKVIHKTVMSGCSSGLQAWTEFHGTCVFLCYAMTTPCRPNYCHILGSCDQTFLTKTNQMTSFLKEFFNFDQIKIKYSLVFARKRKRTGYYIASTQTSIIETKTKCHSILLVPAWHCEYSHTFSNVILYDNAERRITSD